MIADQFTFDNVRAVTNAIAVFLEEQHREQEGVVVGFDNRFLAEEFAAQAAATLMARGIKVFLCQRPAPTPAVAYAVQHWHGGGAIMFTASHNPPHYQGIKYIPYYAGPALPAETARISELLRLSLSENDNGGDRAQVKFRQNLDMVEELLMKSKNHKTKFTPDGFTAELSSPDWAEGLLEVIKPERPYLHHLQGLIDTEAIAAAPPFVVIDAMYGAGLGYLEAFLLPLGCPLRVLRGYRDPLFGGGFPDPSRYNLQELRKVVPELKADLGVALDGDGDRLGVITPDGEYLGANDILTLLLEYLVQERRCQGAVARTVATTHNLDRLAAYYGLQVLETPVGFKFIGQALREADVFLGGEESGGISIREHIPEKDGIMAALLFTEMLAKTGATPGKLFQKISEKIEPLRFNRWDITTEPTRKEQILCRLEGWQPAEIAGLKVVAINRKDGVKVLFTGGGWCLIRPSGTENLFRLYVEGPDEAFLSKCRQGVEQELGL